jgi:hypothetical protein
MIRVDLNVFIWYLLFFQGYPASLYEGAKPARIKGDRLILLMLGNNASSRTSGLRIDVSVGMRGTHVEDVDDWEFSARN